MGVEGGSMGCSLLCRSHNRSLIPSDNLPAVFNVSFADMMLSISLCRRSWMSEPLSSSIRASSLSKTRCLAEFWLPGGSSSALD